jgi:hypothetical protein
MRAPTTLTPTHPRSIRALLLATIVAAAIGFASQTAKPAEAGLSWCGGDPLITIDGHAVDITAYLPLGEILAGNVDGAVVYIVHAPKGSRGNVVLKPDLLFRQEVRFVYDQPRWNGKTTLKVPVDVIVEAKRADFPFKVVGLNLALQIETKHGTSGKPMRFDGAIRPNALLSRLTAPVLGLLD